MTLLTPEGFFAAVRDSYYDCLPVDSYLLCSAYRLPTRHKDPFDRALVWHAIRHGLTLLTVDHVLKEYRADGLQILL